MSESLTQQITRELFESHLEGAAEAMANADKSLLAAQADLAAALGQLTAAQQDSGPFLPAINLSPLNIAKAHLQMAKDQLATYTSKKVGTDVPSGPLIDVTPVNGANHFEVGTDVPSGPSPAASDAAVGSNDTFARLPGEGSAQDACTASATPLPPSSLPSLPSLPSVQNPTPELSNAN